MAEIGPIDEKTETYWMEKWGVYAAGVALLQSVGFWLGNTTGKGGSEISLYLCSRLKKNIYMRCRE